MFELADTPTLTRLAVLRFILATVRMEARCQAAQANLTQHYPLRLSAARAALEKRIQCQAAITLIEDLISQDAQSTSKVQRETFISPP